MATGGNQTKVVKSGNGNEGKANRKSSSRKTKANYRDDVTGNVADILSTSVVVKVGSRGILAKISTQSLTSTTNSIVTLDASASSDADNNVGDLQVPWHPGACTIKLFMVVVYGFS